MIKKSFVQKNFLAILAFGVMVMGAVVALDAVVTPTQVVSQAHGIY